MKLFYSIIISLLSIAGNSQTILHQTESTTRTVQDPQTVIMAPGFRATSGVSNPFVAKIGPGTENPGGGPADSQAGANNPSGTAAPQNESYHDTAGVIDVNSAGQLYFSLPLELPTAALDLGPNLELAYTSGTGTGIAGYGWNIKGITAIARLGKSIEKDGKIAGISLNYSDYYSFLGQRLILKSGLYGRDGAEYVTEKYSNIKIKSFGELSIPGLNGPEYWEVTYEDGSKAWYGATSTENNASRTPIEYNIVKWKDSAGNFISYFYSQNENVSLVSRIEWGGNENVGNQHYNKVVFNYTERSLKEIGYLKGLKFEQSKILTNVLVYSDNLLSKKYEIEYDSPEINNNAQRKSKYQFVKAIREINSENEVANPVVFTSEPLTTSVTENAFAKFDNIVANGDYNGDGYTDFIVKQPAQGSLPEGYFLYFDSLNNSTPNFVYLGGSATYSDTKFISYNIHPNDNVIKPRQGLVLVRNLTQFGQSTGLNLKYYNLKDDLPLNTLAFPLLLENEKNIDTAEYLFDDNTYLLIPPSSNVVEINKTSKYIAAVEADIDSDGISELVIAVEDSARFKHESSGSSGGPQQPCLSIDPDSSVCHWWTEKKLGYRYLIIDKNNLVNGGFNIANTTTEKNIIAAGSIMDIDNDGIQEIVHATPIGNNSSVTYKSKRTVIIGGQTYYEIVSRDVSTPNNNLNIYAITKNLDEYSIYLKSSQVVKGLSEGIQFADFNGDNNIEILLPLALRLDTNANGGNSSIYGHDGWSIYLNKGNGFSESFRGLTPYNPVGVQQSGAVTNHYQGFFMDVNGDGKTDLVSSTARVNYVQNLNVYKTFFHFSILSEFQYNENETNGILWGNEYVLDAFSKEYNRLQVIPIVGNFRIKNSVSKIAFLTNNVDQENDRKIIYYNNFNFRVDKNIVKIDQEENPFRIHYREIDPSIYDPAYSLGKKEQYPFVQLDRLSQIYVVSSIERNTTLRKFRYRGYISHLHGKGFVGFRQIASTDYYSPAVIPTAIWHGVEYDPLNESLPIKSWSIRTNQESQIFPADISENNSQLLQFGSSLYQTEKLVNGQVVNNDNDKAKQVIVNLPKIVKSKDFLRNVVETTTSTYGDFYYPNNVITSVNNNFYTKTTNFEYYHNELGTGSDFYLGRIKSKTDVKQVYGDTNSSKEEFTYENNLLKSVKVWNKDNTAFLLESYGHDNFGNIIEKTISNSTDSKISKSSIKYDNKGRFLIESTDNLGLKSYFSNNYLGQVLTQTDPFDNLVVNTYDSWGKLLTSKSNLSGKKTYFYEKHVAIGMGTVYRKSVTEYQSDGDEIITRINANGQITQVSKKGFKKDQYLTTVFEYDPQGRKILETQPHVLYSPVKSMSINYNDSFYPAKITVTGFDGKKILTSINGNTTVEKEENGYGRIFTKTTDPLGNIVSSTDSGGTINFSYNAIGQQIVAKYDQNTVSTKYDLWGRKSEFNDPANGTYKYEYNGLNQPIKVISPKGYKQFSYNTLGQLTDQHELSTDGTTDKKITYGYDDKGRTTLKSGLSNGKPYVTTALYDNQGRLLSSSESSNGKYFIQKGITYDDKGRIISYEKSLYSSGILTKTNIENVYSDWNGDLKEIKDKSSNKLLWQLLETNERGLVTKAQLGASTITNLYDDNDFLSSVNHSSAVKQDILQIKYAFDALRNELKSRVTGGDFSIAEIFNYDTNNRLTSWTNPRTGQMSNNVYDAKGRILENDQIGNIKFENSAKIYQSTGMTLNTAGVQNYNNDLIQTINYNENNDPVFVDGIKGDVAFQYGLTNMRQRVTYGGNFNDNADGKFTKFYSEDGSFEILVDNVSGQEKHLIYIEGSPYESNIVYLKNYNDSNGTYKFLHKDYLGSILAITDEWGNKLEQRHYDAWGNFTHLQIASGFITTDKNIIDQSSLLLDRGYTGHEHFLEVGIIHMNGRLYDPLLRRFLNADEFIQSPFNTQMYNKYGYGVNNPLIYSDPSGEVFWIVAGAIIGGYIAGAKANGSWNPVKWNWGQTWGYVVGGAAIGAVSGGIGAIAGTAAATATGITSGVLGGAISGAVGGAVGGLISGGGMAAMFGENILQGAASGALSGFVGGAVIGGISGGISQAYSNARVAATGIGAKGNIWTGTPVAAGRSPWAFNNSAKSVPKSATVGSAPKKYNIDVGEMVAAPEIEAGFKVVNGDMTEPVYKLTREFRVVPGQDLSQTSSNLPNSSMVPNIGRKLDFVFGKATGRLHNIQRSTTMNRQLNSIGIFDNAEGRSLLNGHLGSVLNKSEGVLSEGGFVTRESLLMGPNGGLKMESVWKGQDLITIKLMGR